MESILFDFIEQYVPLEEQEKEVLISLNLFHSIKKGTILLSEGEKSQNGYFVLKGCIRTYYIVDGEEKTTAFFTEMEGYTPPSVVSNSPSELFISATEDSILTISDVSMEEEIFGKFPKFEKLCRLLSEDIVIKQQLDLDHFKTSSPEQRYQHILQNRPDLVQRVPQHQLASYLGIKPQSLSRIRARIQSKNV